MKTWLYYASSKIASKKKTLKFTNDGFICRSAYNKEHSAIANAQHVEPGDRMVIMFDDEPQMVVQICDPDDKAVDVNKFPSMAFLPDKHSSNLEQAGYKPDPILKRFTGFIVKKYQREGRNAIQ